jgi:hypothetical protein
VGRSPFILSALFISMTACGPSAPPAPWVVFYERGQVVASVDTSRLSLAGNAQELWLRFDAQPNEVPGKPGTTYTRTEQLNRIDCAGDSVKALRMLMWDPAGNLVNETTREDRWRKMSEHLFARNGIYPALCQWLERRE